MNEFDLIYRYFSAEIAAPAATSRHYPSIIKGIGDDAAVVDTPKPCQMVTCVDTMVQGRHFHDDWDQVNELAFAIGYKVIAVNVSDVAAMGAKPHSVLLALALPKRLANEAWLSEFAKGLSYACEKFNIRLIGGDTTRHDKLIVSVTAQGYLHEDTHPIYRDGAKVGDKVYVSGTIGDACYALTYPDSDIGLQLANRLHLPTPRIHLGQVLAEMGAVNAMIDISDGLIQDLSHICKQSNVSMRINLEQLPTSDGLLHADLIDRLHCQISGGDDYELAFTVAPDVVIADNYEGLNVSCIGRVTQAVHSDNTAIANKSPLPIHLFYHNQRVSKRTPYPFSDFPKLTGYQHFG